MAYFEGLNYSLSNEDTRIEHTLLPEGAERVFSICGSGARVLPLVAKNPKRLDCVDLSREQLLLCELRLAAARALTNEEYLFFLGYRGGVFSNSVVADKRSTLFDRLKLSPEAHQFWAERRQAWEPRGFIFLGKWESHFQNLGKIFRNILRLDMRPIFEAHSLDEQRKLFEKHWKPRVFATFLKVAASEYVFNRFLYKGHFSGSTDARTEARSPSTFIEEEFTRIFKTTLVRKNYFMQILFLGGIYYEEGLPIEAQPMCLEKVRSSKTEVSFLTENLIEVLKRETYDFISLSDTISYLPHDLASSILQLLPPNTKTGTQMIIRSFLRKPPGLNTEGWREEVELNEWAKKLDTTAVYDFDIFSKL